MLSYSFPNLFFFLKYAQINMNIDAKNTMIIDTYLYIDFSKALISEMVLGIRAIVKSKAEKQKVSALSNFIFVIRLNVVSVKCIVIPR